MCIGFSMETKMKKSKNAFTMIELVFVIVILGILSAVAIPRISASRDDAKVSKMAIYLSTIVSDVASYYTSQGNSKWRSATWGDVSQGDLQTAEDTMSNAKNIDIQTMVYLNADASTNCFKIITTDDGNLTIADGLQIADPICTGIAHTSGDIIKTHTFGGMKMVH